MRWSLRTRRSRTIVTGRMKQVHWYTSAAHSDRGGFSCTSSKTLSVSAWDHSSTSYVQSLYIQLIVGHEPYPCDLYVYSMRDEKNTPNIAERTISSEKTDQHDSFEICISCSPVTIHIRHPLPTFIITLTDLFNIADLSEQLCHLLSITVS